MPTRGNDTFGVGYHYNDVEAEKLVTTLGLNDSTQGSELFYDLARHHGGLSRDVRDRAAVKLTQSPV